MAILALRLVAWLHWMPDFPLWRGEDDAELRFQYLLVACVAYSCFFGWVGSVILTSPRRALTMLIGLVCALFLVFGIAGLLPHVQIAMLNPQATNNAVLALYVSWIFLSLLFLILAFKRVK